LALASAVALASISNFSFCLAASSAFFFSSSDFFLAAASFSAFSFLSWASF